VATFAWLTSRQGNRGWGGNPNLCNNLGRSQVSDNSISQLPLSTGMKGNVYANLSKTN
jgi:hypothetical protein